MKSGELADSAATAAAAAAAAAVHPAQESDASGRRGSLPVLSDSRGMDSRSVDTSGAAAIPSSAGASNGGILATPQVCTSSVAQTHTTGVLTHLPHPVASSSSRPEFFRGAAAAITNIVLTFPLNKLISRQAYEGLTIPEAARTLRHDGLSNLYRGAVPPLLQKSVSLGLMYGGFDWYYHQLVFATTGMPESRAAIDLPSSEHWGLRITAALLSGTTECALAPFERIQTILQHRHYTAAFSNSLDVARKLQPYGTSEFYRGVSAIMLRNGPSSALFFSLREPVKSLLALPPHRHGSHAPLPTAGRHALSSEHDDDHTFVVPSQSGPGRPSLPPHPASSVPTGSAAGPVPALPAAGRGTGGVGAPLFPTPEWLRTAGVEFARDFSSGAILGAAISTLFYPLNIAKSVMQLQIGGRHRRVWETLVEVHRERGGVAGLYRGVTVNALRSLLAWGIINSSYEVYKKWI